jgi:hypothetical protein
MGRRKELDGDRRITFRATRRDVRHLQALMRRVARHGIDVDKSQCIRDALAVAASQAAQEEVEELAKLRSKVRDQAAKLKEAREERDRATRRLRRHEAKKPRPKDRFAWLVPMIPQVQELVDYGFSGKSFDHQQLNGIYETCGHSWPRVLERLKKIQVEEG